MMRSPTVAALISIACSAANAASITSKYIRLDYKQCKATGADIFGVPLPANRLAKEQTYQCPGFPRFPLWIKFGRESSITFGIGRNRGIEAFGGRDENWPVEWRGSVSGSTFKPYAVVARMKAMEPQQGIVLAVFRIFESDDVCLLDAIAAGPRQSDLARQLADNSDAECRGE